MITPHESSKIRKALGLYYTRKVADLLDDRQVLNSIGNPHDRTMISHVMSGRRQNPEIEKAIKDLYASLKPEI